MTDKQLGFLSALAESNTLFYISATHDKFDRIVKMRPEIYLNCSKQNVTDELHEILDAKGIVHNYKSYQGTGNKMTFRIRIMRIDDMRKFLRLVIPLMKNKKRPERLRKYLLAHVARNEKLKLTHYVKMRMMSGW